MYFVYILTNLGNNVLYTGFTNDLARRVREHKSGELMGFTKKYHVNKLVYFEKFLDIKDARDRERQIKAGSRDKKLKLVCSTNAKFEDLSVKGLF